MLNFNLLHPQTEANNIRETDIGADSLQNQKYNLSIITDYKKKRYQLVVVYCELRNNAGWFFSRMVYVGTYVSGCGCRAHSILFMS